MVEYDFVKVPIVDIVNQIILYAAQHRASDIHFDPLEDALMVRMRVDGDLQNHAVVPKVYERNLITRIKLVSAMNITETRLPQDGAIKGRIGGRDLDMRVSILPTNEGEKCVIRILDFQKGLSGLDGLGFTPNNFKKIEKMLAVPNGIILVTGATGSGKSTTTYSMLSALNKEETNVITVEDPIEMNIEGINQVQVNSEIGMTFAAALRSILRQDPNVILIGEMRDEETAQIAVRAAITGHLVLSTIHTNNALATLERLFDMGVERYMVATSVVGIISQRLARTLCEKCKKLRPTTKYERYMFARVLHKKVREIYEPVGCDECHGGFTGRIAIHEVLYISEKLSDLIADARIEKDELRNEVYGTGETTTLLQDALQKVLLGYTTFQEIYRVVDIDIDLDNAIKAEMGVKEEERKADVQEDSGWQDFDGVFDDELEIIDMEQVDDDDLPTLDTSIFDVEHTSWEFNKKLAPSDPLFVKFFILENEKIMKEDLYAARTKTEDELNSYSGDLIDSFESDDLVNDLGLTDDSPVMINGVEDIVHGEEVDRPEIKDTDEVVLEENNNNLDNVIGGMATNEFSNKVLDLNNVEFNYREILDLIDAYSDIGPSIDDVVHDTLESEKENQ